MNFSISFLKIDNKEVTVLSTFNKVELDEISVDENGLRSFIIAELKQKRSIVLTNNFDNVAQFFEVPAYYLCTENLLFVNSVLKNHFSNVACFNGPIEPKSFSKILSLFSSELNTQVQKIKS